MKNLKKLSLFIGIFLFLSYLNISCQNKSNTNNNNNSKAETIDGRYVYEDNSAEISINVNGTRWNGKIMIKTGMGSSYNNRKAKYPSGKIKGNDLYESSGMVRVGSISGDNLYYSAFGQTVTLEKE